MSENDDKTSLPWLDPMDENAERRDGNPAYRYTADRLPDEVFKPGYALGVGPRGGGYYSFETKAAYVIVMENIVGVKLDQPEVSRKAERKRKRDLRAFCLARIHSSGPHAPLMEQDILKYGGDPKILSRPYTIRDLSIAGQKGPNTKLASTVKRDRRYHFVRTWTKRQAKNKQKWINRTAKKDQH